MTWLNRILMVCLFISIAILPASAVNQNSEAPTVKEPDPIIVVDDIGTTEPVVAETIAIKSTLGETTETTDDHITIKVTDLNELISRTNALEQQVYDLTISVDDAHAELRERLSIIEEEYVDQAEVDRQYKSLQERIDSL